MAGPPFERYPGPPRGRGDVYRVISPYRDALAWVSNAGRLELVRLMVREGDGWRTVAEDAPEEGEGPPLWAFVQRDPVELVFRATAGAGIDATACVTVTPEGCRVRVEPAEVVDAVASMIATGPWLALERPGRRSVG